MKNVLITGGAGFIGTGLTSLARNAGFRIRILDNLSPQIHGDEPQFLPPEGVEFVRGDVRNRSDLEAALEGVDTIVHLAAETGTGQSMYEVDRYYAVNVQGTALLCDLLANSHHRVRKFILASSRSVYGEGAYLCASCDEAGRNERCYPLARSAEQLAAHRWEPTCPVCSGSVTSTATREDDALLPASIYAASKLAQENLVRIACQSFGIDYAILRFQNVFGEGQSLSNPYTGILSIFSTRLRLGQSLPVFEDGHETRDFVHVEDVATAVLRCMQVDAGNSIMNVGLGKASSIMEVAKILCRLMDSQIEPHVTGQYRVGDIRHNFADIERLKKTVGYSPRISLEEGMGRFCSWVQTQPIPQDLLEKANKELEARKLMG